MKKYHNRGVWLAIFLLIATGLGVQAHALDASREGLNVQMEFSGVKTTSEINRKSRSNVDNLCTPYQPLHQALCQINGSSSSSGSDHHHHHHHHHHKPPQKIGLSFTATTVSTAPQTDVIPLNPTGWVGDRQYILMSYQDIRSFDKKTGRPDGALETDAASFFNFSANDVRIEYDRFSKRWFFSAEAPNPDNLITNVPGELYLVFSNDSVITDHTKWFFYRFPNAQIIPQITPLGSGSIDYHQLAIDQKAVYLSMDTFDGENNFLGTTALIVEKSSLLAGNPIVTAFPGLLPGPDPGIAEFLPPADNFDEDPHFAYFIHASSSSYPSDIAYDQLFLYRIARPGSHKPALFGPVAVTVPSYAPAANAPHQGNLFGSSGFLQTGLFGGLMAPHIRDHQLFACHAIQVDNTGTGAPDGDRVAVRWYQLDLTGDGSGRGRHHESLDTVPALVQVGTLFDARDTPNPKFYYVPSIMTNKRHDLVISGTVSGADNFTNAFFAGRSKHDPQGTLHRPVLTTHNISNSYNFGPLANPSNANIGQRWGDESGLAPDPVNDLDLWSTGQWAAVPNGWGIQVTQLKPHSSE